MSSTKKLVTAVGEAATKCGYKKVYRVIHDVALALENVKDLKLTVTDSGKQPSLEFTYPSNVLNLKKFVVRILQNFPEQGSIEVKINGNTTYHDPHNSQALSALLSDLKRQANKPKITTINPIKCASSGVSLKVPEHTNKSDQPVAKKQKIENHSSALMALPLDILSKILSYANNLSWCTLASVNKLFQHVLFEGTEDILYPIFYLFNNLSLLCLPENHPTLCRILTQIEKIKFDLTSLAKLCRFWELDWSINSLLMTVSRHPAFFEKQQAGVLKLMGVAKWDCDFALMCPLPEIAEQAQTAHSCYSVNAALIANDYTSYRCRNAVMDGNACGKKLYEAFSGYTPPEEIKLGFWQSMIALHIDVTNRLFYTRKICTVIAAACSDIESLAMEERQLRARELLVLITLAMVRDGNLEPSRYDLVAKLKGETSMPWYLHMFRQFHYHYEGIEDKLELELNEIDAMRLIEVYPPSFRIFQNLPRQAVELAILGEVKTIPTKCTIDYHKFKAVPHCSEFDCIPDVLNSDPQFVKEAILLDESCVQHISPLLLNDMSFIKAMVSMRPKVVEYLKPDNEEEAKAIVSEVVIARQIAEVGVERALNNAAYSPNAFLLKILEMHWQDEDIFFKILLANPSLPLNDILTPEREEYYANKTSREEFQKKVVMAAPIFLGKYKNVQLTKEERKSLLEKALQYPFHFRHIPYSCIADYTELVVASIEKSESIFQNIPQIATSIFEISKAAISTETSLVQHLSRVTLRDPLFVLKLLQEIPQLREDIETHVRLPYSTSIVVSFINGVLGRKNIHFSNRHPEEYFEIPLFIRQDPTFLDKMNSYKNVKFLTSEVIKEGKSHRHVENIPREEEMRMIMLRLGAPHVVWSSHIIDDSDSSSSSSDSD